MDYGSWDPDDDETQTQAEPQRRHDAGVQEPARLVECCLEPQEVLMVSLLRLLMLGRAAGDGRRLEAALGVSTDVHGPELGALFFARCLCLASAVHTERVGDFAIAPPRCPHMTPDERLVLGAVQARRLKDRERAATATHRLLAGGFDAHLGEALQAMATMLETLNPVGPGDDPARPSARLH
jgi:hypothetical protein